MTTYELYKEVISRGNMGQNTNTKNPGSYQNNHWKKFVEMDFQQSAHKILDILKMFFIQYLML